MTVLVIQGIQHIERLKNQYTKLCETLKQEQLKRDRLVQNIKALKYSLRNRFAGVTVNETTGTTLVCEEPAL